LTQAPDLASNVGRCVIMGGAPCCEGNVTPAAEYNIWVDPDAARIVFRSGLPIELVGWQLCRGPAVLAPADIELIGKLGTELGHFAVDCNSIAREAYRVQTGEDGISLPDPVAMSIALDPSIGSESSRHYVEIETATELTRGMTVVDRRWWIAWASRPTSGTAGRGANWWNEVLRRKSIGPSMRRVGNRRSTLP
jgi:purine nucleosidase